MKGCPDCDRLTAGCCPLHTTTFYPQMPSRAAVCPVCGGKGTVSAGFYSVPPGSSTNAMPETCRSCDGRGYVVV